MADAKEAEGTPTQRRNSFFGGSSKTEGRRRTLRTYSVDGERFSLESRYRVAEFLGKGAYGVVVSAEDTRENKMVAIKKVKQVFNSRTLAKRTLRELRLLRHLHHDNIVRVVSILRPVSSSSFTELYIIMELMETDLCSIIRSSQPLRDEHVAFFMYQLVRGLKYLHTAGIVHRDLKPRNLLVNRNCDLKICDFGLARITDTSSETKTAALTEYVTTRWYRAPEVIVGWPRYTAAVDIWACGTILAEFLGRRPLFPGLDSLNQLDLIAHLMGKPPESFISRARRTSFRAHMREMETGQPLNLATVYPRANPAALDLLDRMLRYDPEERITAAESLTHEYVRSLHEADMEPEGPVIPPAEFAFENVKPDIDHLREEILNEVRAYHPYMRLSNNIMSMLRRGSKTDGGARRASFSHTSPSAGGAAGAGGEQPAAGPHTSPHRTVRKASSSDAPPVAGGAAAAAAAASSSSSSSQRGSGQHHAKRASYTSGQEPPPQAAAAAENLADMALAAAEQHKAREDGRGNHHHHHHHQREQQQQHHHHHQRSATRSGATSGRVQEIGRTHARAGSSLR